MDDIIYIGVFLDDSEDLLGWFEDTLEPLHLYPHADHMTCVFRPESAEGFELGAVLDLEVVGWASDEFGQAVVVRGCESDNEHPHITVACDLGTKPFYSNELLSRGFEPIDGPTLRGRVGAYMSDGIVCFGPISHAA